MEMNQFDNNMEQSPFSAEEMARSLAGEQGMKIENQEELKKVLLGSEYGISAIDILPLETDVAKMNHTALRGHGFWFTVKMGDKYL
jgi:hypothetical protein